MRFRVPVLSAFAAALVLASIAPCPEPKPPEPPKEPVWSPPKGYVCHRADGPITVDGKLDEAAWKAVPWTDDFVDIEGDRRPKPRFRTRAKMLWDDDNFYIAAELEEPHVWATLRKHDSVIFRDNDFEVFINPAGDSHVYAELELNALNTTWDLLLTMPYKDAGCAVDAWEVAGLKTAVHVDGTLNDPRDRDRTWTVEIAWPWKGLKELTIRKVPPKDGERWRVNFSRVEWEHEIVEGKYRTMKGKAEDNWVWSPQGVVDMHRPERWGYVQFSIAPPGKAVFVPDPAEPAKQLLHRVYYAQRAYHARHGKWAESLADLGLKDVTHPTVTGPPKLETTTRLFEARVELKERGDGPRRWCIRQDAKVWGE
jgi:hypothetical protein